METLKGVREIVLGKETFAFERKTDGRLRVRSSRVRTRSVENEECFTILVFAIDLMIVAVREINELVPCQT